MGQTVIELIENSEGRQELWQWDLGRKVRVIPAEGITVDEVHFGNALPGEALVVVPKVDETTGDIIANVPNILATQFFRINVYAVMVIPDGKITTERIMLDVEAREKPSDYVYTETEIKNYDALEKRIKALEENGGGGGNGKPGADGFSPIASVEQTANGAEITITDKNGTTKATVKNGKDGADGADGKDGYTPQKGIDYFDGKDGADGKDGLNGKDGADGKTAYQYAKDGGYTGTEEEFAQKLAKEYPTREEVNKLSEDKVDRTIFEKLLLKLGYTMDDLQEILKTLPSVYLVGDLTGISADAYVNVMCEFVDDTNNINFTNYAEIAWQGSSSVNFKKEIDGVDVAKNYKIKLYSDEGRTTKDKRTFRDWHATNNYHIKCNYADCTNFMNNMMMHYLTKTYQYLTPLPREGARYTVDGFPIKLYINGVFCGIRFWNLKQDDKVYNLNEDDLCYQVGLHDGTNQGNNSGAFVYGNLANGSFVDAHAEIDYYWEDRVWEKTSNHPSVLYDTIQWVSEATDEEFKANLEQHFNKEYLINYFVMMYACGMIDSKGKNFNMLYFPDMGVWYPTFWDMDNAFGTYYTMKTTEHNIELNRFGCPSSRLFDKLWANFKDECVQKYWELRETVLTVEQVKDSIKSVWSNFVDTDLIAENDVTKYDGTSYDGLFKTDGEVFVTEWAEKRFAYMDIVMSFEISDTELTLTSFDSKTLTVKANTSEEIVWTSSNKGIATVENGVVTPIKNGSCVITVTIGSFKATCNVTVNVEIEEDGLYVSGYIGEGGVLTAGTNEYTSTSYVEASGFITISIRNILETSSKSVGTIRVAEYDENKIFVKRGYRGNIYINSAKDYTADFKLSDSTKYVRVGFVTTLTDESALTDLFSNYELILTLSAYYLTFNNPDNQTLIVTTNSTEQVEWLSDDETIATVENGVVTPITKGTCKITATIGDMSATCDVIVGNILYRNGYVGDSGEMTSPNTTTDYMAFKHNEASGTATVSIADALESTRSLVSTIRYAEYDENKTFIKRGYKAITNNSASITLDASTRFIRIGVSFKSSVTDEEVLYDFFTKYTVASN